MEINNCRLCKSAALDTILDWGNVPLTGVFPAPGEVVPTSPLHLVRCWQCGLVQLRHTADPASLFGPDYGYRSGQNPSMVDHLAQVADMAQRLRLLHDTNDVVVDIGGNDGTLLKNFDGKAVTVNIDPCAEYVAGVDKRIAQRLFDADTAAYLKDRFGSVRYVFTLAMFYDLDDPLTFARQVRELLADDGLWVLEVADADRMLLDTIYDGICHEHLTYWNNETLTNLVLAAGFEVVKREWNRINGGSLLFYCKKGPEVEGKFQSYDQTTIWRQFAAKVNQHRQWMLDLLFKVECQDRKVFGLGASTKGNVMLWNLNVGRNNLIRAIGEINEQKIGKETPVDRIPIISQQEALDQADDLIVFPWHFRKFFEETLRPKLRPGQRLIYPLPF